MKKISWTKRIAAGFLALLLWTVQAEASVTMGGDGTVYPEKEHGEVSLDKMSRDLFDQEAFEEAAEELSSLAEKRGQEKKVRELYQVILEETDNLYTQYVLLTLDYYKDVENEEAARKYEETGNLLMEAGNTAAETLRDLVNSEFYGQVLREEMGPENAAAFAGYESVTPEESRLTEKEMDLVREYEEALMQDYEDSREENQVLGEIYLELVETRTELARLQGYDNYADYAYECGYYRDYTVEDVERLRESVKEELVPLYEACLSYATEQNAGLIFTERETDAEEMLDSLAPVMEKIRPEIGDAYEYFRSYHLYDIEPDEKKMDMGYTVELPAYGDAYIYDNSYGTYQDYFTIIHEFGHFTSVFYEDSHYLYSTVNMDVSEIHSQGMEVLFWPYYEELAPGMGESMQAYVVFELLSNIITCCIYDEIEQEIYRNPDMSLQELNQAAEDISSQYGGDQTLDPYQWVELTHLYQQPLYVISYATSALAALEILELSAEDADQALEVYMEISASGTSRPYCAVLDGCGLRDIFQEGSLEETAGNIADLLDLTVEKTDESQEEPPAGGILEQVLAGLEDWAGEIFAGGGRTLWDRLQ